MKKYYILINYLHLVVALVALIRIEFQRYSFSAAYLMERSAVETAVDREKLKQLVEMGFPEKRARDALISAKYSFTD